MTTIARGSATGNDFANLGLLLKELSGAGKTTVTDADFTATPGNRTVVLVRNTTDNTVKLAVRANGTWRYATFS